MTASQDLSSIQLLLPSACCWAAGSLEMSKHQAIVASTSSKAWHTGSLEGRLGGH